MDFTFKVGIGILTTYALQGLSFLVILSVFFGYGPGGNIYITG